jgi:hypothetical protein
MKNNGNYSTDYTNEYSPNLQQPRSQQEPRWMEKPLSLERCCLFAASDYDKGRE